MSAASALGDLAAGIAIRAEDSVLTAELQAGSEEAFALLISQYQAPIYSLISRVDESRFGTEHCFLGRSRSRRESSLTCS